jgi:hypothetical protein
MHYFVKSNTSTYCDAVIFFEEEIFTKDENSRCIWRVSDLLLSHTPHDQRPSVELPVGSSSTISNMRSHKNANKQKPKQPHLIIPPSFFPDYTVAVTVSLALFAHAI